MKIIRVTAGADGSRPPVQTWAGETAPEGYAWVPEELDDGRFEAANGFVSLTLDSRGTAVTAMAENSAARQAWLAGQAEEKLAISAAETMLELLADHEYRLCLLELGAAE